MATSRAPSRACRRLRLGVTLGGAAAAGGLQSPWNTAAETTNYLYVCCASRPGRSGSERPRRLLVFSTTVDNEIQPGDSDAPPEAAKLRQESANNRGDYDSGIEVHGPLQELVLAMEPWHVCPSPSARHLYIALSDNCLLYTSPSPRDGLLPRMPSSA